MTGLDNDAYGQKLQIAIAKEAFTAPEPLVADICFRQTRYTVIYNPVMSLSNFQTTVRQNHTSACVQEVSAPVDCRAISVFACTRAFYLSPSQL